MCLRAASQCVKYYDYHTKCSFSSLYFDSWENCLENRAQFKAMKLGAGWIVDVKSNSLFLRMR